MYHSIHSEFIEAPLTEILEEGIQACLPLGVGIHTEPMKEYFLSSLFLRMTGAQEQKLKCICWELATHDYDFRHSNFFGGKYSFGEMSRKEDKRELYKGLLKSISLFDEGYKDKYKYRKQKATTEEIIKLLRGSPILEAWLHSDLAFCSIENLFSEKSAGGTIPLDYTCGSSSNLMGAKIGDDYDQVVYRHRNRCAHNLVSYQSHLPELDVLKAENYPRQNYVYRFIILVLIDEIFVELYKKYKELITKRPGY